MPPPPCEAVHPVNSALVNVSELVVLIRVFVEQSVLIDVLQVAEGRG